MAVGKYSKKGSKEITIVASNGPSSLGLILE